MNTMIMIIFIRTPFSTENFAKDIFSPFLLFPEAFLLLLLYKDSESLYYIYFLNPLQFPFLKRETKKYKMIKFFHKFFVLPLIKGDSRGIPLFTKSCSGINQCSIRKAIYAIDHKFIANL